MSADSCSACVAQPAGTCDFALNGCGPCPRRISSPRFGCIRFSALKMIRVPRPHCIRRRSMLGCDVVSSNSQGTFCLLCGRFKRDTSTLGRTFSRLGKRRFSSVVLSLHCGPKKCMGASRRLYSTLTPTATVKRPFLRVACGSGVGGARALGFRSDPLAKKTDLSCRGLCILASNGATSTSRVIVGYLGPCVRNHLCRMKTTAFKGGITRRLFAGTRTPNIRL